MFEQLNKLTEETPLRKDIEDAFKQRLRDPVIGPIVLALAAANVKVIYTLTTGITDGQQALKYAEPFWHEAWKWDAWWCPSRSCWAFVMGLAYALVWPWILPRIYRMYERLNVQTRSAIKKIRYGTALTIREWTETLVFKNMVEDCEALKSFIVRTADRGRQGHLVRVITGAVSPGTFARLDGDDEVIEYDRSTNSTALVYVEGTVSTRLALCALGQAKVEWPKAYSSAKYLGISFDGTLRPVSDQDGEANFTGLKKDDDGIYGTVFISPSPIRFASEIHTVAKK